MLFESQDLGLQAPLDKQSLLRPVLRQLLSSAADGRISMRDPAVTLNVKTEMTGNQPLDDAPDSIRHDIFLQSWCDRLASLRSGVL
jgi:hypothetical protein